MAGTMGVMQEYIVAVLLTTVIAFLPSIFYMILLRYAEKYNRESWRDLANSFIWGATVAVVVVIIVRGVFIVQFKDEYPKYYSYIAAVVVTPLIAEVIKPAGMFFIRDAIVESEDGLIHGGTIGLGFAATENLLYGVFLFTTYGFKLLIITVIIRSLSVVLINCVTTALVCYGISRVTAKTHAGGTILLFPLFFIGAVGISAVFNLFAITGQQLFGQATIFSYSLSLLFAIIPSVVFLVFVYFKIYRLDRMDDEDKIAAKEQTQREKVLGSRARYSQQKPPAQQQRAASQARQPSGPIMMDRPLGPQLGPRSPPPRAAPPQRQTRPAPSPPPRAAPSQRPPPKAAPPPRSPPPRAAPPQRQSRPTPTPPPRAAPPRASPPPPPRQSRPITPPRPPPKRATFEPDDEVEFTPRPSSRSSKKPSFEVEKDDDEWI